MGTRLIFNSKLLFWKKQFLCNPYRQVTLWFFVILHYICIYGYKHIYTGLIVFPFLNFLYHKILLNFLRGIIPAYIRFTLMNIIVTVLPTYTMFLRNYSFNLWFEKSSIPICQYKLIQFKITEIRNIMPLTINCASSYCTK